VHVVKKDHFETDECYFKDSIKKWKELNGTSHFSAFLKDIRPFAQSLPQVLYHKQSVVSTLIHHLSVNDTLAYEPLLKYIFSFSSLV
jgi:U3 small nucleolar RNA-associated protein 20